MTQHDITADGRRAPRFLDPTAVTWLDPLEIVLGDAEADFVGLAIPEIVDESVGGIALAFGDPPRLEVGDEVPITHNGTTRPAVVRNIRPLESGRIRVGFEWRDA